ncbi:dihydrolipoamide acetyltransferase family protein [Pontibacillus litoralis]|uniref:Dihydrolipoamide acetyltransferase component of pyruvate dehydrogenase complex n=1 Tax=Pontibacillus litoralis JSM 072002 TaxID=1385512 RepID=A0A0A5G6T0_9BACI|nr:dihydrolipoamide acetyltransferase family protein [Pontibacillus litoralis]KGX86873.1 dihydrolipoyllysine acetyltransferase [Pontibacillus litoralis JSM 072002]
MEVKLHDIGEGMTEAEIVHYFVQPGDAVVVDQPLVEVQTDKMTAELPAPANGTIEDVLVKVGETIKVGTTVLSMITTSQPTSAVSEEKESTIEQQWQAKTFRIEKRKQPILASPYTRKMAREQGVNIEEIKGTGPAGRIVDEDVYAYVQKEKESLLQENSPTQQVMKQEKEIHIIPFKGRRKQIAKKMKQSLHTIAHCSHFEEVDVTNVLQWKEQSKQAGKNVSLTAYFVKAVSLALKDYPIFNATLNEEKEQIEVQTSHHIGLATNTEEGVIVPVLKHVEHKSLLTIQAEMRALTEKALHHTLSREEITGGSFTISNVGPLQGSIGATPIIHHPQTGIMAFHKTKKRPAVVEDEIVIRSMMNVSMTFDHRVADGATAVQFTNRLVELIEHPNLLTLELV